jgi:hypothetical protein
VLLGRHDLPLRKDVDSRCACLAADLHALSGRFDPAVLPHGVNIGVQLPRADGCDILPLGTEEVPVGANQTQRLEVALGLPGRSCAATARRAPRAPRAFIAQPSATSMDAG